MDTRDSELKYVPESGSKGFEVVRNPALGGFIYDIYFSTKEAAVKAVTDFFHERSGGDTDQNFESGMWDPTAHILDHGDRTAPIRMYGSEKEKHPGMSVHIQFNGNTNALSPDGEAILRKLGFID